MKFPGENKSAGYDPTFEKQPLDRSKKKYNFTTMWNSKFGLLAIQEISVIAESVDEARKKVAEINSELGPDIFHAGYQLNSIEELQ